MRVGDLVVGTGARVFRTTGVGLAEGVGTPATLGEEADGFNADSRTTQKGEYFFALKGERSDGHDFVPDVLRAGAAGAVVSTQWLEKNRGSYGALPPNRLILSTPSPEQALQCLALHWRRKHDITVVGVTGSLGKTTVKEATAQALSPLGETTVLKTTGNLNTEVGLPLELLRLNSNHRYAVLEMGMYQRGDIRLLANIAKPAIGIVTNVHANHMSRTGSIEHTAQGKAELIHALPSTGLAVLNGDDTWVRLMAAASPAPALFYGRWPSSDLAVDTVEPADSRGFRMVVKHGGKTMSILCPLPGTHNAMNLLPAMAVGHHVGVSWADMADAFTTLAIPGRMEFRSARGGFTILDDRYNASAASVSAALDVLRRESGRKFAMLGEMFELGTQEEAEHRLVGRNSADLDGLILLGDRTRWIAQEAEMAGLSSDRISRVANIDDAVRVALAELRSGDTLLVKGSRSLHMEDVVAALIDDSVEIRR